MTAGTTSPGPGGGVPQRPVRGAARPGSAGLPIVGWAVLLCGTAVGATLLTAGVVLHLLHGLDLAVLAAAAAGLVAGTGVCVVAAAAGDRLATAITAVHVEALRRRPSRRRRPVVSRELSELAAVVDTLRWRTRTADELAERRRQEVATASAGVQELVSGLVAAEESARGQLAAELHDTVAQSLMLSRSLLARSPLTPLELAALSDHLEDAEEQVRAVMARTRPPALRDGDLADAVAGLRDDFRARYALTVDVRWPSEPVPLPLAAAITVYRFFQEALLNVVKHADVDEVDLALEVLPDGVVASVRDAGPGFEPDLVRADRGRHVGLGLLGERARLSGGRLDVHSGGGHEGTLLRLWLPRPAQVERTVQIPRQRRAG